MEDSMVDRASMGFDEKIGGKRGRGEEKGKMGRLEKRASGVVMVVDEYNGEEMINGVKYEEEKEILANASPKVGDQVKSDEVVEKSQDLGGGGNDGGGGGGIISNFISSVFHQKETGGGGGGEVEEQGGEAEKNGGGSVIDSIVAQLPRSLSEDVVPATTDEASLLIHSAVHD